MIQEYNPSQDLNSFVENDNLNTGNFLRQMCKDDGFLEYKTDEDENAKNPDEEENVNNVNKVEDHVDDAQVFGDHSDLEGEDFMVYPDELTEDSFHSDSSNVDSTYNDVCQYKNQRAKKGQAKEDDKTNKKTVKENLNEKAK